MKFEGRAPSHQAFPIRGFGWTVLGAGLMLLLTRFDYAWTLFLREHRWRALKDILGRSLFEGEGLGGGDPVVFFLIGMTLLYYLSWRPPGRACILRWRPQLGFGVSSAVICGIYLVHGLKWIMGRARPYEVIKHELPYTAWYAVGPHFVTDGIYHGSFPSGHTIQVFLLFSVAYMLAGDRRNAPRLRLAGRLWGAVALTYALVMGAGRCMSLSHWVSDVVGGILLAWLVMHLLYDRVLDVPGQNDYFRRCGHYPAMPAAWELRLCFWLLPWTLGLMAVAFGTRAIWHADARLLVLLIPAGLVLGIFTHFRITALLKKVHCDSG